MHEPGSDSTSSSSAAARRGASRAAWEDDVDVARRLVARGADVNAKDETQQSAYLVATSEGHLGLLELALASGADVDDKDSWDGTGLIRAAERGHHLVVGRLLRAGIDKDHVNRIGYQAIHEAVWFGADEADELSTVQVLVAGGVQLDRPSGQEGLTPLEMARQRGYRRLGRVLEAAAAHQSFPDPGCGTLSLRPLGGRRSVALALRDGADLRRSTPPGAAPSCSPRRGTTAKSARVLVALGANRW